MGVSTGRSLVSKDANEEMLTSAARAQCDGGRKSVSPAVEVLLESVVVGSAMFQKHPGINRRDSEYGDLYLNL